MSDALAPSLEDLAALAEQAFAALPTTVRDLTGDVLFRIDDFPAQEVLQELGIEDPFELTGLYQGADLAHRSVFDPNPEPARVFLYRRPILDEWVERGDITLLELISHILVHEVGHHFGLSDDDIEAIEGQD
jgi:predicted Zn-dependent protease with MMP-like domain